jgi:dethiobiotin synthetase
MGPEGEPGVWELMAAVGLPALVVARSGLGTLNHTTLTVERLRGAGVAVAGIVMNDGAAGGSLAGDVSVATNRAWLERMTGIAVVARLGVSGATPCVDG